MLVCNMDVYSVFQLLKNGSGNDILSQIFSVHMVIIQVSYVFLFLD